MELALSCWWAELRSRGSWGSWPLVCEAGPLVVNRGLRSLAAGSLGLVLSPLMDQAVSQGVWTQGSFRQPACCRVELCSCSAGCLA